MKRVLLVMSLVWCAVSYQEAHAQGFWYVAPGSDFNYRYGIDAGNGLGLGYIFGYGYGNAATPEIALSNAAVDLARFQNQSSWANLQAMNSEDQFVVDDSWSTWTPMSAGKAKPAHAKLKKVTHAAKKPVALPKSNLLTPLTDDQFDRTTGTVQWPKALLSDAFSVGRVHVESQLRAIAQQSEMTEARDGLRGRVAGLKQDLRQQIRKIPTKDYLEAKSFLKSLAAEG